MIQRWFLALLLAALAGSVWAASAAHAQGAGEWIVNTNADTTGGCPQQCSLRAAIEAANQSNGGVIRFAHAMTIRPTWALPQLAAPSITIDATQLGGSLDTAPSVWLEGANAGDAAGIEIIAEHAAVSGLGIAGFQRYGIGVLGPAAADARIEHNWIGMTSNGRPEPNQLSGVAVIGGAARARISANRIGGNSVTGRTGHGIVIGGGGSTEAQIIDNVIGIGVNGESLPNDDGILIVDSAQATVRGNVIGYNYVAGIEVRETRIPIEINANWIGVRRDGGSASNDVGVFLGPGAAAVRVGTGGANVIAANRVGIAVEQGAREAELWNNWIGLVPTGESMTAKELPAATVLPNAERGISIIAGAAVIKVINNIVAAGSYGIVIADAETSQVSLIRNVVAGARTGRTLAAVDVRAGAKINIGGDRGNGNHICGATVGLSLQQITEVSVTGNLIGPGAATRITFDSDSHTGIGVELGAGVVRAEVTGNQFSGVARTAIAVTGSDARGNNLIGNGFDSNGIDIDLGGDGATANDPDDADSGPNGLLNFPLIQSHTVTVDSFKQLQSTFSGTAEPRSQVFIYTLDGHRKNHLARTTADADGRWKAIALELPTTAIRALSRSRSRDTSEFSPPWEPSRRNTLRSGVSHLTWRGPETPVAEAFSKVADHLISVWRWDAPSQRWQLWAPGVAGANVEHVRHGDVLRLEFERGVSQDFFTPPRGTDTAVAVHLHPGLNEVSWLDEPADPVEALTALNREQPDLLSIVRQWDEAYGGWRVIWPRQLGAWTPPRWTGDGRERILIRASQSGLWAQRP